MYGGERKNIRSLVNWGGCMGLILVMNVGKS